jgi:hypothetical protein
MFATTNEVWHWQIFECQFQKSIIMTIKRGLHPFFFNWRESDGQNSVAAIVLSRAKNSGTVYYYRHFQNSIFWLCFEVSMVIYCTSILCLRLYLHVTEPPSSTSHEPPLFRNYRVFKNWRIPYSERGWKGASGACKHKNSLFLKKI